MANKKQKKNVEPVASANEAKRFSVKKPQTRRQKVILLVAAVVVIGLGFLVKEYVQTRNELSKARDPQTAAQADAEKIVKETGKYLDLPDEKPTTATVTDKTKLQDQPIFKRAEDGDKVLIYSQAQRAMLYRPSTKKVIEYAPVNLAAGEQKAGTKQ